MDTEYLQQLERNLALNAERVQNVEADRAETWDQIENDAQIVANSLRTRSDSNDIHSILGESSLTLSITTLITTALHGLPTPDPAHAPVISELLRVAANVCIDHDVNRDRLLKAKLPEVIASLLQGYIETLEGKTICKLPLNIQDLKIVRNAIGVLVNVSLGFDAVKARLNTLGIASTVVRLSSSIYPVGSWTWLLPKECDMTDRIFEESWTLRSVIASWTWKLIDELKDFKEENLKVFNADILLDITPNLAKFCPPYPTSTRFDFDESFIGTLVEVDFNVLEETCLLIEFLALEDEDTRLRLAHKSSGLLSKILDFIEHGSCPPTWKHTAIPEAEFSRLKKGFDVCNAALVNVVVEVSGEDKNEEFLWSDSDEAMPGGEFVFRMASWLKNYVVEAENSEEQISGRVEGRRDLVICASLCLGNLARREITSTALLLPPHSLAPIISSKYFLSQGIDIKVQHGIFGLLKHLSQSCAQSILTSEALVSSHVVQKICKSGIWSLATDPMIGIVQLRAIGIVKHMCLINSDQALAFVLPSAVVDGTTKSGLHQIMSLISTSHSESFPICSEGTRLLVNAIKSLSSGDAQTASTGPMSSPRNPEDKETGMQELLTSECALALAHFIARSARFPILINEGTMALSLLSLRKEGLPLVLEAIYSKIPSPVPSLGESPSSFSPASDSSSPSCATPPSNHENPSAIDTMVAVLRNVDNPVNFPVEVRVNVCTFLTQLAREVGEDEHLRLRETVGSALTRIAQFAEIQGQDEVLVSAAKKAIDELS